MLLLWLFVLGWGVLLLLRWGSVMLLLLGWGVMILSGRTDPMHFVRGGIAPSIAGFLF